jgi:hypothetical protein
LRMMIPPNANTSEQTKVEDCLCILSIMRECADLRNCVWIGIMDTQPASSEHGIHRRSSLRTLLEGTVNHFRNGANVQGV